VAGARVQVDLEEVERLAGEAEARLAGEPALALAAAERALALLGRGPFLADEPDADWALPARREADRLAAGVRHLGWDAALALGDHARALAHAEAAAAADPLDESAWRAVMLAYASAGEPAAALAAYERLRQTLAEGLGTDPSTESRTIHLAVLRGDPVTASSALAPGAALSDPAPGAARNLPVPGRVPRWGSVADPEGPRPRLSTAPAGAAESPAAESWAGGGGAGGAGAAGVDAGFVGREAELADLSRAWEAAVGRRPQLVLVAGEAGIGKTRLVGALAELAGATGGLVVQARCYEAERSLFLQPLAEAVRAAALAPPPARLAAAAGDAAGTLAELVPELRRLLDLPGYERAPAELERRRSFEAVTAFVRGLAAQQPLLLAVDDLHQAGASTLELLHFLLRRLAGDACCWWPPSGPRRAPTPSPPWPTWAGCWSWAPCRRPPWPSWPAASAWPTWPARCWSGPGATPCSRWRACGRRPRAAATGPPSRRRSATRC
jgi:hypothetical protein